MHIWSKHGQALAVLVLLIIGVDPVLKCIQLAVPIATWTSITLRQLGENAHPVQG